MTADRAPFFKQICQKMSHSYGGVEFFSKFRSFAATLDKDCNDLKSRIENDEVSTDSEGRSHLILREILADVQKFKVAFEAVVYEWFIECFMYTLQASLT